MYDVIESECLRSKTYCLLNNLRHGHLVHNSQTYILRRDWFIAFLQDDIGSAWFFRIAIEYSYYVNEGRWAVIEYMALGCISQVSLLYF